MGFYTRDTALNSRTKSQPKVTRPSSSKKNSYHFNYHEKSYNAMFLNWFHMFQIENILKFCEKTLNTILLAFKDRIFVKKNGSYFMPASIYHFYIHMMNIIFYLGKRFLEWEGSYSAFLVLISCLYFFWERGLIQSTKEFWSSNLPFAKNVDCNKTFWVFCKFETKLC